MKIQEILKTQPETNETLATILNRSSCRRFTNQELTSAEIHTLLLTMQRAPSAGNRQPWHFYIIFNQEIKEKLVEASHGQKFLADAPVVFAITAKPSESAARYGDRGAELYSIQDTAAAIQNLMLAAESLGLCSCWVGAFDDQTVVEILNLDEQRPVALIPIGHREGKTVMTKRKPLEEITTILD